jgi:hypothetical protein
MSSRLSVWRWIVGLGLLWLRERRARNRLTADFWGLCIATTAAARHGTDEQLDDLYDRWHWGLRTNG